MSSETTEHEPGIQFLLAPGEQSFFATEQFSQLLSFAAAPALAGLAAFAVWLMIMQWRREMRQRATMRASLERVLRRPKAGADARPGPRDQRPG